MIAESAEVLLQGVSIYLVSYKAKTGPTVNFIRFGQTDLPKAGQAKLEEAPTETAEAEPEPAEKKEQIEVKDLCVAFIRHDT